MSKMQFHHDWRGTAAFLLPWDQSSFKGKFIIRFLSDNNKKSERVERMITQQYTLKQQEKPLKEIWCLAKIQMKRFHSLLSGTLLILWSAKQRASTRSNAKEFLFYTQAPFYADCQMFLWAVSWLDWRVETILNMLRGAAIKSRDMGTRKTWVFHYF